MKHQEIAVPSETLLKEDAHDLELYNKAIAEYQDNPVTYSLDEVEKELDLKK